MDAISFSEDSIIQNKSSMHQSMAELKAHELLVLTVSIGDGRQDILTIHTNDDPEVLAKDFARKHGLELSIQQYLVDLIRSNKEILEKTHSYPSNQK